MKVKWFRLRSYLLFPFYLLWLKTPTGKYRTNRYQLFTDLLQAYNQGLRDLYYVEHPTSMLPGESAFEWERGGFFQWRKEYEAMQNRMNRVEQHCRKTDEFCRRKV